MLFIQLPEQIKQHWHYRGLKMVGSIWVEGDTALVESYPGGDRDEAHTDYWEKTSDGWVLTRSDVAEGGMPWSFIE